MKPTEILSNEHRVIEQVLACLQKMIEQSQSQQKLAEQPARDAIAFFRMFADRCHHGKEEAHLFPAMEAKGFSRETGPTGVMLREHELGRAHVRGMDQAIEAAAAGDAEALRQFAEHGRAYIELLREHIQKEDHCLFAMADQAFDQQDQQTLLDAFQRVEAEEMGAGTHETYLKIGNDLADRYGVPHATSHAHGHTVRCCGH